MTADGEALIARRRAARAERFTGMFAALAPAEQAALTAALPALQHLPEIA